MATTPAAKVEPTFEEKYLLQLVGRKIVAIVRDGGSEYTEEMFGLELDNAKVAWIQCDPEGNGPGHLAIEGTTNAVH